jgi:hypothetical protein
MRRSRSNRRSEATTLATRSRGSAEAKPSTRTRRKRPVVTSKTTGRKLILPADVHDRLWLLARQRKTSVSAVATEILDRNLPRFSVTREG